VQNATGSAKRDGHYYGIKDLAMTKDATCGFMLWDGESKGTLTNVVNLLNTKKKTLLYLGPQSKKFGNKARSGVFSYMRSYPIGVTIQNVSQQEDKSRVRPRDDRFRRAGARQPKETHYGAETEL
jgi:hypothetical protein